MKHRHESKFNAAESQLAIYIDCFVPLFGIVVISVNDKMIAREELIFPQTYTRRRLEHICEAVVALIIDLINFVGYARHPDGSGIGTLTYS